MLDELYQDIILQAARDTSTRGTLADVPGAFQVRLNNPLCGDSIDLWVSFDQDRVSAVKFEGQGCLISQAAACLIVRETESADYHELKTKLQYFRALVQDSVSEVELTSLGQLSVLGGIRKIPSRVRCALLACEALERVLRAYEERKAEKESEYLNPDIFPTSVSPHLI